jgi:hypothetical protein
MAWDLSNDDDEYVVMKARVLSAYDNQAFHHCDKYQRETDLFWFIVSEVSVHGYLVPLLWRCNREYILEKSSSLHGGQES